MLNSLIQTLWNNQETKVLKLEILLLVTLQHSNFRIQIQQQIYFHLYKEE
jgi:hypothetical protein